MHRHLKALIFSFSLLFITHHQLSAAITTYDETFTTNDIYGADFSSRLNSNFQRSLTGGINSINSANIVDDSLDEADMADNINPRIRTYEGASCEFVDDGLLPATSASLSTTISAGTAYPRGYRCDKASATNKTYGASLWTWTDIDQNCDFQYPTAAIGGATPAVSTNSIRLARVSTDATTVNTVTDLRVTSCSQGAFSDLASTTGAASNLDEVLKTGKNRASADNGWVQGLRVSWDGLTTTFTVKPGSAYINGYYRVNTVDTSVPQTADAPSTGTSGLDTGAIAASTRYFVYAAADEDGAEDMSFSISASPTAPTGVTNYRKIAQIQTDASSSYVSRDMLTYHTVSTIEMIGGWVKFDGSTTPLQLADAFNVSSLTDNGTGDHTATWDTDFETPNYSFSGAAHGTGGAATRTFGINGGTSNPQLAGSLRFNTFNSAGSDTDSPIVAVMAIGKKKE